MNNDQVPKHLSRAKSHEIASSKKEVNQPCDNSSKNSAEQGQVRLEKIEMSKLPLSTSASPSQLSSSSEGEIQTRPSRGYVAAKNRPVNSSSKLKFYRFFSFNTAHPGVAGAIAESKEEAIERIILRFFENVSTISNNNALLLEQLDTADATVKSPSVPGTVELTDSLGGWNCELANSDLVELSSIIKRDLEQSVYVEYPIDKCAFYFGGP